MDDENQLRFIGQFNQSKATVEDKHDLIITPIHYI